MKLSKYIATLLLIVPISVNAGPFGAVMGQSQESLDDVTVRDKGWVLFTPSKPHPDLTLYLGRLSEKSGLCSIRAVAKPYDDSLDGAKSRALYKKWIERLSQKYGEGFGIDEVRGDLYTGENSWLESHAYNVRDTFYKWDVGGEEVDVIVIQFLAGGLMRMSYIIEYFFANHDKCDAEIEQVINSSL